MPRQRLQKIIGAAGITSRRQAEELIAAGQVTVNGQTVTAPGSKADPLSDHIKVRGRLINPALNQRSHVYILLNKPKGYLTTVEDERGRPVVTQLVPAAFGRLHPVGRLDFNSEGLLLLTNDGAFTNQITSAGSHVAKVYRVKVKGIPAETAIDRLRRGIAIGPGERTAPAEIRKLRTTNNNAWFEVVLYQGRNQQLRRMFDCIGYSVLKLRRTKIGTLEDNQLKPGEWRKLSVKEVRSFQRK